LISDRPNRNWRPSIGICMHRDTFPIDRFVLVFEEQNFSIAKQLSEEISVVSPETEVVLESLRNWKNPWDFKEVYESLYQLALDYPFDPSKEDYYAHITTGTHAAQIAWFSLIESALIPGKILQTYQERDDAFETPRDWDGFEPTERSGETKTGFEKVDVAEERFDVMRRRFAEKSTTNVERLKGGIKTENEKYNRLILDIEKIAGRDPWPILLTGATGVGKTTIAERIFELKKTDMELEGEFVSANCATFGNLASSELFGHEKGAFTGAVKKRDGLLKKANGGVLFLDEIGELNVEVQALLLKALEEKTFYPLGSDKEQFSDFQLISGTNKNLSFAIEKGEFRGDLLARIDTWTFLMPSLKERREDIEPNLDAELKELSIERKKDVSINKEARLAFLKFARSPKATWDGNFRDLKKAVRRMATFAESGRIGTTEAREESKRLLDSWRKPEREGRRLARLLLGKRAEEHDLFELLQLEGVLEACRNADSQSAAGRKLYAVSRKNKKSSNDSDRLGKFLRGFGLDWKTVKETLAEESDFRNQ
jgi:transcriptional regulatory protein RtcR